MLPGGVVVGLEHGPVASEELQLARVGVLGEGGGQVLAEGGGRERLGDEGVRERVDLGATLPIDQVDLGRARGPGRDGGADFLFSS